MISQFFFKDKYNNVKDNLFEKKHKLIQASIAFKHIFHHYTYFDLQKNNNV